MNQVGFDGTWPRALSKQLNLNQRRKWSGQTVPAVEMFSKNHREEKKKFNCWPRTVPSIRDRKQALGFKGVIKPLTIHLT